MRLILVIDDITLYPIWFSIIPGNIQDFNTLKNIINDVKTSLHIEIKNFVLDAGYVSKELIQKYETQKYGEEFPEHRYLARMPARKGYPFKDLYQRNKKYLYKGTFDFVREGHTYFGKSETVLIFDKEVNCYVFLDQNNALRGYTDYLSKNIEEFEESTQKDREWIKVKDGFFILVANYIKNPEEILRDYFDRTSIEAAFKTDKEYLKILPLRKWTHKNVQGKLFSDIITSIFRQKILEVAKNREWSVSSLIGKCQSLMCKFDKNKKIVFVEYPSKQVKNFYKEFNVLIPDEVDLNAYLNSLFKYYL